MKKSNVVSKVVLLTISLVILFSNLVLAKEDTENTLEYSESYKEWLKLPEEERLKTYMPGMYDTPYYTKEETTDYFTAQYNSILRAVVENTERYRLDEDGVEIIVKDQGYTNECWAFSLTSVLETTCYKVCGALAGLEFSPRHMDYSTIGIFSDGTIESDTWNREPGEGGNFEQGLSYIVSGKGPVLEEDMPAVVDKVEEKISKSEIEGKQVQAKVKEAVFFPSINKYKDGNEITYTDGEKNELSRDEVEEIRDSIKEHIMTYGAVSSQISSSLYPYMNEDTLAYNSDAKSAGHAITIIGWDDNYSKENFNEDYKPNEDGAWIVLQSYGTSDNTVKPGMADYVGDGFFYVSYEDTIIETYVNGISEITTIDHDNIYQYDYIPKTGYTSVENGERIKVEFDKKTNKNEKLTEVGLYATEAMDVTIIYSDSNGEKVVSDKTRIYPGYSTVKLNSPQEIKDNTFAIIVKINSTDNKSDVNIPIEMVSGGTKPNISQRCSKEFVLPFGMSTWMPAQTSDFCIKAFTVNGDTEIIEPSEVTLNKTELTLEVGKTETLIATIKPDNANSKKGLTWKSSDTNIVEVSQDGKVTAKKAGSAEVSVVTENNKKAICKITTKDPIILAESITLNKSEISLEEEQTFKLEATIKPDNTTDKTISWSSENIDIAEVDTNGNISAKKVGETNIKASTNNGVTATCKVTVTPKTIKVESISLNSTSEEIIKGRQITLVAQILPYNASDKTVTWTSNNENIATVNNGVVTAINEGTAIITAKSNNGKTATCNIKVVPDPLIPREIVVNTENVEIIEGLKYQLTSSIIPDTASQEIRWESKNNAIAIVDSTGMIRGLMPGETEIVGTSVTNTAITKTIKVKVLEKQITNVEISKTPNKLTYIQNYETLDLTGGMIKVYYDNNTQEEISMTSNLVSVEGFNNSLTRVLNIAVTYSKAPDIKMSFQVEIIPVEIETIKIGSYPNKTIYISENDEIDLTGGTIIVYYTNKTEKEVKMTDVDSISYELKDENEKKILYVTLEYENKIISFNYEIAIREIYSVSIYKLPSKTTYYIGEELNLEGGELLVTYTDKYVDIVKMTDEKCRVTNFDNTSVGEKTIGLMFNNKLLTFTVTVTTNTSKVVDKIEIKTMPSKLEYLKNTDPLDLEGGVLKVTYLDGKVVEKDLTDPEIIVEGFNNSVLGDRTLTVKYMGKEATFTVKIVDEYEISEIILTEPNKKEYIVKEETTLNLDGGLLTIKYKNGSQDKIIDLKNENVIISGFDGNTVGKQTITVDYKGRKVTYEVNVIRVIRKITINQLPSKLEYTESDQTLDLTGGSILAEYNDGYKEIIDMTSNEITADGFNRGVPGVQTITLTYKNLKTSFPIAISKKVKSISFKAEPVKKQYLYGIDSLDLTGGVLIVTYEDDSQMEIILPSNKVSVSGFDKTKLGEQIITITYKDKTVSYKIEVIKEIEEVKTVERISIKQLPDKLEYVVGKDNLDLSGGILLVRYSDGTVTEVEMTNARVVILGFSNVNVGIRTLTVSFEGKTTTFDIEIIEEISEAELIEKIEIYKLPTKLKYIANLEQLDLSGGSIKVIYEDGTEENVLMTDEDVEVTGFDNTRVGIQRLLVKYNGKTTSFNVEIVEDYEEKEIEKIEFVSLPSKTKYELGDDLDLSGGKIKVTYTDGNVSIIDLTNENVSVSGYDKYKEGLQLVTITYKNKTLEFSVDVVEKIVDDEIEIKSIKIKSLPNKTSYIVGEELDLEGGVIEVTYSDETKEEISMTDQNVIITGYDKNKVGNQILTVNYNKKLTTFTVIVEEKGSDDDNDNENDDNVDDGKDDNDNDNEDEVKVEKISIKSLPNKTKYKVGEELELEGGVIEVTYSDGSTKEVSLTDSKVKVTGYDNEKIGMQQVTVSYENKITTFTVQIEEEKEDEEGNEEPSNVRSISIKKLPNKTTYKTGDELELDGGILEVTYTDGSKEEIEMTDSGVTVEGYDTFKAGVQQLTIRYGGQETTLTVKLEESDEIKGSKLEEEAKEQEEKEEKKAVDTGDNIETYIIYLIGSFIVIVATGRIIKHI